jgi:hypothetical protein
LERRVGKRAKVGAAEKPIAVAGKAEVEPVAQSSWDQAEDLSQMAQPAKAPTGMKDRVEILVGKALVQKQPTRRVLPVKPVVGEQSRAKW